MQCPLVIIFYITFLYCFPPSMKWTPPHHVATTHCKFSLCLVKFEKFSLFYSFYLSSLSSFYTKLHRHIIVMMLIVPGNLHCYLFIYLLIFFSIFLYFTLLLFLKQEHLSDYWYQSFYLIIISPLCLLEILHQNDFMFLFSVPYFLYHLR